MTNVEQGQQLKRPVTRTGELIPAVGLGTYQSFEAGVSESERAPLREVLRSFVLAGGSVVDSSPMYGSAESVVGDLAEDLGNRASLFLTTKVWTTGREAGVQQMEQSLRRFKTGMIDLMQVHNLVDWKTQLATIRAWQKEGKVRYSGITHYTTSVFDEIAQVMRTEKPDFIQIYYSILTRRAEERILPLAADLGIAVIVNRPFETAALFSRVRGKSLPPWAAEFGCSTWSGFFLKYVLSHPAVTCVIPATSEPAHLLDNMQAGLGPLPDSHARGKMATYLESL